LTALHLAGNFRHPCSTRLIGASGLEAVAVSVGVSRTPAGLHSAA
jgi:hypothetical protein